ncbi:hypothetical protein SAMN04490183_2799 [Pseudomonas corrugata]|nr:hypothetical protein SAMN04490183_2799 [Pseudomonas corrugata]
MAVSPSTVVKSHAIAGNRVGLLSDLTRAGRNTDGLAIDGLSYGTSVWPGFLHANKEVIDALCNP